MDLDFCKINSQHEIRILRLWPKIFGSQLRGELRIQTLTSERPRETGDMPRKRRYQALSYTWGSWVEFKHIRIDMNHHVRVTENLWRALHYLRNSVQFLDLWIDQICIDQKNVLERNHQVALMGEIYRHAEQVLVWLGTPEPRLDGVVEKLRWMTNLPTSQMFMKAAEDALRREVPPWHTRGWVIQEVVLAAKHPVICVGKSRYQYNEILGSFQFPHWFATVQILTLNMIRYSAVSLVDFANILQATVTKDPRDKIYSLLNLLQDGTQELIQPDYYASTASVYAQATFAFLTVHRSLGFLALAKCCSPGRTKNPLWQSWPRHEALPTWAVDFEFLDPVRVEFVRYPPLKHVLRPWCWSRPNFQPVISHRLGKGMLNVLALEFDRIIEFTTLPESFVEEPPVRYCSILQPAGPEYGKSIFEKFAGRETSFRNPYVALEKAKPRLVLNDQLWRAFFAHISIADSQLASDFDDNYTLPQILCAWTAHYGLSPHTYDVDSTESELRLELKWWYSHISIDSFVGQTAKLYLTANGFIGIGSQELQVGDVIALPYGSPAPVILQGQPDKTCKFLGFTYVHGIMEQELMDYPDLELKERDFILV